MSFTRAQYNRLLKDVRENVVQNMHVDAEYYDSWLLALDAVQEATDGMSFQDMLGAASHFSDQTVEHLNGIWVRATGGQQHAEWFIRHYVLSGLVQESFLIFDEEEYGESVWSDGPDGWDWWYGFRSWAASDAYYEYTPPHRRRF